MPTQGGSSDGEEIFDVGSPDLHISDCVTCSADMHQVIDCDGVPIATCDDEDACDAASGSCIAACDAVASNQSSVGCEYWATKMDQYSGYDALGVCFAAFVANTWSSPVAIDVEFEGVSLPVEEFARIPSGAGPGLSLAPYVAAQGLAPGEVAILFLSGPTGADEDWKIPCPVTPAITDEVAVTGTSVGSSFRIGTDVPVVAYQINPYGAGTGGAVAGASLLLPTSTFGLWVWGWGTNATTVATANRSYAFPGGMNVRPINDVVVNPAG